MTLFLLLSCGSGSTNAEDPKTVFLTFIANLGKGFLNVFTSFSDMITGAFGIKADDKKSDIGAYFTRISETMTSVKEKLQDEVAKNGNYEKVKTVVDKFIKEVLDKIAEGAKIAASGATGTSSELIGSATKNSGATAPKADSINTLVKGIKTIVDVVLKKDEGSAEATKTAEDDKKDIGKLFSTTADDGTDAEAAAASASIGAVSGADILKAIAKSGEAATAGDIKINEAKNAAEIAATNKADTKEAKQKDAVIAAGIALRAMAKDGKFAAKNEEKSANAVNGTVASAVGKTLSTLIIAIRNTVDSGLKKINEALATVKQEDKSAEATNPAEATTSGQQ
ncbi:variable large family protein [Borrelia hermsii]|uniref:Variable large protein n=2 Tax=Borrelia hermsii TaxID=140 RepID=A0AAN1CFH1_BORHE|nr:variable large family protein [Borrelia hermsii]AMR76136.1 Variable large protein 79 [Borrelia hermsii]UPA08630.1 variable large family protein [Borrelia hermsii DAH]